MDTLTHAISGAVIGIATSAREPQQIRRRALCGALFAAFPDADVLMVLFTDHFTYLNEHRGYTHSIVMLPIWAALLGWVAARTGNLRRREMVTLAAAALAAHILGDLITSYGTKVFKPLYDAPFAFPITFIIDPWFTLILLTGVMTSLWRNATRPAAISGMTLCAYLIMQTFAQQAAMRVGTEYTASLGHRDAPVIVFPQPLSPFNWKVIVVIDETYRYTYVNLLDDDPRATPSGDAHLLARVHALYQPVDSLEWKTVSRWPRDTEYRSLAMAAWLAGEFDGFREFALLPYVTRIRGGDQGLCVWFTDLRFTLGGMRAPFEYAMCRSRSGAWSLDPDAEK